MKRKFHELNLYSYIFYRHLENTIILTWKILILASFSMILDSDLGFQNRFSGKCTRFFWVANPSVIYFQFEIIFVFFSSVGKNLKTDFDLRKSDLKSENHPKKSNNKKWFRSKSKSQTRWFKSRFKSFSI